MRLKASQCPATDDKHHHTTLPSGKAACISGKPFVAIPSNLPFSLDQTHRILSFGPIGRSLPWHPNCTKRTTHPFRSPPCQSHSRPKLPKCSKSLVATKIRTRARKRRKKGCTKQLSPGAAAGGCAFDGAKIALQPIADVAHLVHGPIACEGNSWDNRHSAIKWPANLPHRLHHRHK